MCRWCLGRVSVMCSDCVVMFWWYVGDALVLCWWCLCSVSVMLWCLSDGWWCCGDRDGIVMFRWWILMNILRFSVGSEAKRVAVRCVFAIGVVCWANCSFGEVKIYKWIYTIWLFFYESIYESMSFFNVDESLFESNLIFYIENMFTLCGRSTDSSEPEKNSYFPVYWLFNRDPYNGLF